MKTNYKMQYVLATICILSIFFTSCGDSRIPYSELPEPENYALTVNDLPDLGRTWDEQVYEDVGDEENGNKSYTVYFSAYSFDFSVGGNSGFSVRVINNVIVYQHDMAQSEIPEPVAVQPTGTITWQQVTLLYPIGDKALVWLGRVENGSDIIYTQLGFFKKNIYVVVFITTLGFTEEETLDLAHDLARKVETRVP